MNKTALIVDDSRSARVVLKRILETHDLDVDMAESAEDALDYLIEKRPDVIFMDHLMPGMDGFEAVSAIKQNPDTATIPIMMYTSQKGEVYLGQARALGAVGVLPKEIAPAEISKVLASLHIIGDEKQQPSADEALPVQDADATPAEAETLGKDIRNLVQELFEEQRTVMRSDLRDTYKAIAARIDESIPAPSPDEPAEKPLLDESAPQPLPEAPKASGFLRSAVVLLLVFNLLFAWLFWQRSQTIVDLQVQNVELRDIIDSQRVSASEEMQRALETQRISDANESLQMMRQLGDYQQTLDTLKAVTIDSLEWSANLASEYPYGDPPLGDERLEIVERLTDYLLAINFSGVVRIETHVANYCLMVAGADGYAPAKDGMVAECDRIGLSSEEALQIGSGQSVTFANYIRLAEERSGGRMNYEIVSMGNTDPLIEYPTTTAGVEASTWNRIAAANNRVVISILPGSN